MSHEAENPTPREAASDTPAAALPAPPSAAPADAEGGIASAGDAAASPDGDTEAPGSAEPADGAASPDGDTEAPGSAEPADGASTEGGSAAVPAAPAAPAAPAVPPFGVPGPRDPWAPPVPMAPGHGQFGAPAGYHPWAPPVPQPPQEHVALTKRPVPEGAPAPGPDEQPRDPWAPPAPDAAPVPPQPPHPGGPGWPAYSTYPGYPAYPAYPGHPGYPANPGYVTDPYGGWAPPARNGVGVTAMILAIVGAVLAVSCFGAFLGLPLGIAAVVCGIVGLRFARRGEATNRAQAMTGVILGAVSVVLSAAMIALMVNGISEGWLDGPGGDLVESRNGDWAAPLDDGGTAVYEDGVHVTLSDARPAEGLPTGLVGEGTAVTFTVEVVNTGDGIADLSESEISAYPADEEEESLPNLSAGRGLSGELEAGERTTAEVTVVVPMDDEDGIFQVEVAPGYAYDYTYWHLDVP